MPAAAGRTADLVGDFAGLRWAVELRHASRPLRADASFEPADARPLPYPTLEAYFALCWREKREQLEATTAAEGCARGLLLVCAEGAWTEASERALARAYREAGRPEAVHFGVLSGGALRLFPVV